MPLAARIQDLAVRIGTEFKAVRATIGTLAGLTTTDKTSTVAAINEVRTLAQSASSSGGAQINDAGTSPTTVWSSTKTASQIDTSVAALVATAPAALDTLAELATALGNRVRVDGAQSFTAPQQTQGRGNIGAASAADLTALTTAVGNTEQDFVAVFVAALT